VQLAPSALQRPDRQQLLPVQPPSAQQGSPGPPQCWQIPSPLLTAPHTNPVVQLGVTPAPVAGQQASPGPPQVEQRFPRQERLSR
jgi:hypothetical protein